MELHISYELNNYKIYGWLTDSDNAPLVGALIVLTPKINPDIKFKTISNEDGYFEFYLSRSMLSPGVYDVLTFGSGTIQKYAPLGDWQTIELIDPNKAIVIKLLASPSAIISEINGVLSPANVTITATVVGLSNVIYAWYINDTLVSGINGNVCTFATATYIGSNDYAEVKCVATGLDLLSRQNSGEEIINISKTSALHSGIIFRGLYSPVKTYYSNALRTDAVIYQGVYYLCKVNETTGAWDNSKWDLFDENFSSVATGLLLAEDATINHTLTVGTEGENIGIIKSANVQSLTSGNGFYMSDEGGSGIFWVGNIIEYSFHGGATGVLDKGLFWDGTNIQVKGTNFELTQDGSLWAKAGGFGNISTEPKVLISDNGLEVHDNSTLRLMITDTNTLWSDQSSLKTIYTTEELHNASFDRPELLSTFWNQSYVADGLSVTPNCPVSNSMLEQVNSTGHIALFYKNTTLSKIYYNLVGTYTLTNWVTLSGSNTYIHIGFTYKNNVPILSDDVGSIVLNVLDSSSNIIKSWAISNGKNITSNALVMSDWTTFDGLVITDTTQIKLQIVITNVCAVMDYITNPIELYMDSLEVSTYEPFTLISKEGFLAFNSPASYLKIGPNEFTFKGTNVSIDDLTVTGTLTVKGTTIAAANNLFGTTQNSFTIGTETSSGSTYLIFGAYASNPSLTYNDNDGFTFNKPLTATNFRHKVGANTTKFGSYTVKYSVLNINLENNTPLVLPDNFTYIMGNYSLLVFVNGVLKYKDIDYAEFSTTSNSTIGDSVKFLYNLATGANIAYLIQEVLT